jgi:hypothetical protein
MMGAGEHIADLLEEGNGLLILGVIDPQNVAVCSG